MKPYGVPRKKDVEAPDVSDIQRYGLNSKRLDGKKDYHRTGKTRNARRRVWKKSARRAGRKEIYEVE